MDPISPFEPTVLGAAWRFRWLVLAVVVVFVDLGYALAVTQSSGNEWTATATVIVEDPAAATLFETGGVQRPERYLENQVEILRSDAVAQRGAELASQGDPAVSLEVRDLINNTKIVSSSSSDAIEITFRSDNGDAALAGANVMASAYRDVRRSEAVRSFSASIAQLDASIVDSESELEELQLQIDELLSASPARQELEAQFEEALVELVQLQRSRRGSNNQTLDTVRGALDDILQQLETLNVILALEDQGSELTVLSAKQEAAVERLSALTVRRDQLEVDSELAGGGVVFISPAIDAELVGGSSVIRTLAVALVLGGLVAVGLAYALALRRRKFSDRTEPELVLGAPMLAEVPNFRDERLKTQLPVRDKPFSAAAEAFRFNATAIGLNLGAGHDRGRLSVGGVKSIAVISGLPDEGKSVVAANTALALAREDKHVLVIDADFEGQRLSRLLSPGREPAAGLTEVIADGTPMADVIFEVDMEKEGRLSLLSSGEVRPPAADLLQSDSAEKLFNSVRGEYDVVIIDTPPLLHVAYASTLLRYADAALVVVPHGSNVSVLEELLDRTELVDIRLLGYVYNMAPLRRKFRGSESSKQDRPGSGGSAKTPPTAAVPATAPPKPSTSSTTPNS